MKNSKFFKIIKNNKILVIIIISLFITFIFSLINIINWFIDKSNIEKQINNIDSVVEVIEKVDSDMTEIIEPVDIIDEKKPYFDYIKMNMIDVDFSELKKINNKTIGWIRVNGTNINYPFVHTSDNDYYLTHSFDKTYNKAGWIFMDYRNNSDFSDKNTIIYGHGRTDTTMFGSIKNIIRSNWFDDSDNFIIKLSTVHENTLWQVFSVYQIPTTSDYLQIDFINDNAFLNFVNDLIGRSYFDFKTNVSSKDTILTLSTCHNYDERVVMHAKLIKKEKK